MQRGLVLIGLLLLLAGCGASPTSTPTPAMPPMDAALAALKAAGLPIAEVTTYTAATDPNHLLGRPNQYTAKLSWHDSRLPAPADPTAIEVSDGGGLELWPDQAAAQARADYIQGIGKSLPAFAEYDFVHGPLLLRLAKDSDSRTRRAAFDAAMP